MHTLRDIEIYEAIDGKKLALSIFNDQTKAFDSFSHEELLNIFERIEFRGDSYNYKNCTAKKKGITGCLKNDIEAFQFL